MSVSVPRCRVPRCRVPRCRNSARTHRHGHGRTSPGPHAAPHRMPSRARHGMVCMAWCVWHGVYGMVCMACGARWDKATPIRPFPPRMLPPRMLPPRVLPPRMLPPGVLPPIRLLRRRRRLPLFGDAQRLGNLRNVGGCSVCLRVEGALGQLLRPSDRPKRQAKGRLRLRVRVRAPQVKSGGG
jgi:hypothetical protein